MSVTYSILVSLAVCATAAGLEALFAGKNVRPFLTKLRTPPFSPSLFVWGLIGVGYYAICFTLLYRLFSQEQHSPIRAVPLPLMWRGAVLNRWEGALLLIGYAVYLYSLIP